MPRASFLLLSCLCVAVPAAKGLSNQRDFQTPLIEEFDCSGIQCLEGKSLLQLHVSGPVLGEKVLDGFNYMLDPELEHPIHNNATMHGPLPEVSMMQPHETTVFHSFMKKHHREYAPGTPDYDMRKQLFVKRTSEAAMHNSKPNRRWTAGVNKLADRSEKELRELLGWSGKASAGAMTEGEGMAFSFLQVSEEPIHNWGHGSSRQLPGGVSWAHLNATNYIHNQGLCGSCWAVSSVSVLQAHMEIHAPKSARPLSVQELVSCVDNPRHCGGEGACDGATAELAMDYAMRYGLASAPETAEAVSPSEDMLSLIQLRCPAKASPAILLSQTANYHAQADTSSPGARYGGRSPLQAGRAIGMQGWERLPPNSYAPLMHALVERGPAAVAVFASQWFQYAHGIFDSCQKDAVIDHAVALLGYGDDEKLGAKYWLVQNSWGPEWGEGGHIRLLRNHNDETDYCGIDSQPKEGTGCDGGPAQVKVCGQCGILYDTVVPIF